MLASYGRYILAFGWTGNADADYGMCDGCMRASVRSDAGDEGIAPTPAMGMCNLPRTGDYRSPCLGIRSFL